METYVSRRHKTVAQFVVTSLIMDMYLVADRHKGSWVSKKFWEHKVLDLEGMLNEYGEAEQEKGEGEEDTDD